MHFQCTFSSISGSTSFNISTSKGKW
jgi:hypothetical protein